jgi:hypothetical protein
MCRLRWDLRTRAYVDRRTTESLSKKKIIRCLERYVVSEVFSAILADLRPKISP